MVLREHNINVTQCARNDHMWEQDVFSTLNVHLHCSCLALCDVGAHEFRQVQSAHC